MKRVTFKVAKALKDAGYPQELNDKNEYYSTNIDKDNPDCEITDEPFTPYRFETSVYEYYVAPTYLEIWLWLWREKKACIGILFDDGDCTVEIRANKSFLRDFDSRFDPEEAIKSAIEFLVDNDLIK